MKTFIADEVNDMYTADVTNAGKLKTEDGASSSLFLNSAHSTISATTAYGGACYLKGVLLGQIPQTAATLVIYDTSISAGNVSGFGTDGANIKAKLSWAYGANSAGVSAAVGLQPIYIPMNVYMTSGLAYGIGGHSANDSQGYVGCLKSTTLVYQS